MKQHANSTNPFRMGSSPLKTVLFITALLLQCLLFAEKTVAQNVTVRGTVTRDDGQPVQRPSVIIKGSANGVTGDDNGKFSFS